MELPPPWFLMENPIKPLFGEPWFIGLSCYNGKSFYNGKSY
jgi:hypothetical protein